MLPLGDGQSVTFFFTKRTSVPDFLGTFVRFQNVRLNMCVATVVYAEIIVKQVNLADMALGMFCHKNV
jgi:hypothetical protein